LLAGCSSPADVGDASTLDAAPAVLGSVSVQQLSTQLQSKDFVLVNVHVPREGQIPGTDAHAPYNDSNALAAAVGADRARKVVVYCKSNSMSTQAGQKLVAMGYRSVRYLDGGMTGWQSAGNALEP
jgi:rhodanese-related sulfurtransferase